MEGEKLERSLQNNPKYQGNISCKDGLNKGQKCSLGISNFLEEISSLSHSIVFLYFFALITEEAFLISPCYSLELCIQMGICRGPALVDPGNLKRGRHWRGKKLIYLLI